MSLSSMQKPYLEAQVKSVTRSERLVTRWPCWRKGRNNARSIKDTSEERTSRFQKNKLSKFTTALKTDPPSGDSS